VVKRQPKMIESRKWSDLFLPCKNGTQFTSAINCRKAISPLIGGLPQSAHVLSNFMLVRPILDRNVKAFPQVHFTNANNTSKIFGYIMCPMCADWATFYTEQVPQVLVPQVQTFLTSLCSSCVSGLIIC
jgi:hypothetical protein